MRPAFPPNVWLAVLPYQLLLPPLHHHPLNHHPLEDQHRLQYPVQVHLHNGIELSFTRPAYADLYVREHQANVLNHAVELQRWSSVNGVWVRSS